VGRELREVVFVDGVRTAFGRAGPKGVFWRTRADDMAVKAVRELLRRNAQIPVERIGDVIFAATAQVGDQGLTLGRDVALLSGIPQSVPGFAVDRMCAGALTAVTAGAGEIALGAADVVLAGGVEHMGHHPMGATSSSIRASSPSDWSTRAPSRWARRRRICTTDSPS
jgi:acetyl-CoA acyltransferase